MDKIYRREEINLFRQDENVGYGNHQRKQQSFTVTNLKHPLFKPQQSKKEIISIKNKEVGVRRKLVVLVLKTGKTTKKGTLLLSKRPRDC